ncbi:response regulator [Pseudodesulfovibrio sp. F-1]|uniref:histidine kinase n=1 Tax=Pseudodesulfovibrio alkaliphilus TaxID=2661613 RepID=A0A7K1KPD2_9BACT|nr:ATP-binding protein [Pseudodesulfovibrio alkaliphilus]MUM77927.1 response regulator [Pseudodesulfovibrio alkaliphilus]
MRSLSIFKKTGILAVALFGVVALLTSALAAYMLHDRMVAEYVSKGTAIAQSIAGASQEILLNRDSATVQAMIDQYLEIEGVAYVFVRDGDRTVVSHTFVPEMPPRLATLAEPEDGVRVTQVTVESLGRVIDVGVPVLAGVAGHVHVGMSKELIKRYFWATVVRMQALLFATLLACVGILFVVTRRISRPLQQLTEYADRLASRDFSADIELTSRDEVGHLGRTMRSMARELARLFSDMESEVEKATGELREHMVYLSAIIDNLADGLLVISPAGAVSVVNPAMREFFGLGDKDYSGFAAADVFPVEVADLARAIRSCEGVIQSAEIPLPQGRTGMAVGSSILVADPVARCLGGVVLVRDITREKALDQLKTDFISTVSHELRTPMTSILGFARLIGKKLDTAVLPALDENPEASRMAAQVADNVEIIVTEARRLTDLINDVLDIAKMEAGEIVWHDRAVFMGEVMHQAADATRGLWSAKGIEVVIHAEADLPPVRGDHARLVQVLVNLISNAVKFASRGPVTCRAHLDRAQVLVSVADHGPGIPESSMGEIFDKFKQVGDTLTEKPAGTGLGLPICRQIVERHGGRIWVESEMGEGSVFFFSIPALVPRTDTQDMDAACRAVLPEPDSAMLVRLSEDRNLPPLILVVDDDPILGAYFTELFEGNGFRVMVAADGEQAVVMARDHLPGLITMDLMMPGMDGRTAIRCLRHNPFTRHIPVLVLSALSESATPGCDVALTKPVDDGRLVEVVRALLLRKDVRHSCLVLGGLEDVTVEGLTVVCPDDTTFCPPQQIWSHVERGFRGLVLIPAELAEKIDIDLLARAPGVTVIIMPARSGWEKTI